MCELAVLTTARPPVSIDMARLVLQQHYRLAGEIQPLPGERDANFRITLPDGARWMARFINPAEPEAESTFQTALLGHLRGAVLPTPILLADTGGQYQPVVRIGGAPVRLRVVSYLPGEPLSTLAPGRELSAALGCALAALYRGLDTLEHPHARRELLWDITRPQALRQLPGAIAATPVAPLIEQALEEHQQRVVPQYRHVPWRVIHNDLNPHNLLASNDHRQISGIIDFGDALYAPRINELGTALAYLLADGEDPLIFIRPLLAALHPRFPLMDSELALLPELMAARMALTVTIASWRALREPENRDYIVRNVPAAVTGLRQLMRCPREALRQDLLSAAHQGGHHAH